MPTHKKPESERFKGPVKYEEYLVARALVTALQRLPIRFAYRLGCAVGWLAWLTISGRRRIVPKMESLVASQVGEPFREVVSVRRTLEEFCDAALKVPQPRQCFWLAHKERKAIRHCFPTETVDQDQPRAGLAFS